MNALIPTNKTHPKSLINTVRQKLAAYGNLLLRPTDGASLAAFRILFGALMVFETFRYFQYDRITRYYVEPVYYFTYELFPMVSPWPEPWIYVHFVLMGLFAAGIMLGLFYRVSAYLFFLAYTYVFLLDKTQHNNHYYLIILISLLLIFVDAHKVASLDRWRKGWGQEPDSESVPFWNIFILRAQLVIVYFYAGVAKLNVDWLAGEPMRSWLQNRAHYPVVGSFFMTEAAPYFFAYGGMLFDLSIGFLLLWRRTRWVVIGPLLFFHLMNKWLFNIGIFPYLMIAATIIFLESNWLRRVLRRAVPEIPRLWPSGQNFNRPWIVAFVSIYLILQILIPLRHWLYPGDVSWTEEGHRFSWHMKLRSKSAAVIFYVTDPATNQTWEIDFSHVLNDRQYDKMTSRPDMILQFAHAMRDQFEATGQVKAPIIRAEAWASLNGRPTQQLIDPTVDLAQEPATLFGHYTWIIPLQERPPSVEEPLTEN